MSVLKSAVIAFAMYSKIPMPQFAWKEKDMKYVISFFPLVGVVIGALVCGWAYVCYLAGIGTMAFALVGAAIPVLVSGGIHIDGFLDIMDAFHSYQPREKKLEILKDPHIGAFAVICGAVYGMLYIAAFSEVQNEQALAELAGGFYLSRILSGIAVVSFPCAKKDGLLYLFSSRAHERIVKATLYLQLAVCIFFLCMTSLFLGSMMTIGALLTFGYYKIRMNRELGGITGDAAGYFVTVCEGVFVLIAAVYSLAA